MAPYFLRNLVPRKEKREDARPLLTVLASLTWVQWAQFWSGWLAWTCDAIDFFSVSLSVIHLQDQFGKSTHTITTSITLTLLFRSLGAVIFGIASDRFGRKWPLVANLILVAILELPPASSTPSPNFSPPSVEPGWRALFWTAAAISLFAAGVRAVVPESEVFLRAREEERRKGVVTSAGTKTRIFLKETKEMLKNHWMLCIYAVLLMTGFNFLSHGSQDLYPTYLQTSKNFTPHDATIATIIGNCGAITGGVIAGYVSQHIGRRLTIVIFVCLVGAFIPLWILPSSFGGLSAGAFFLQVGVQGAWGVIPIQLAEMSPPAFRATFPGVAYQIGNMISAASAQIEATGGNNMKTTIVKDGVPTVVPDYAKVQGIFIGVIAAFVIFITIIGPENHGSHFEKSKAAFEEGAATDALRDSTQDSALDDGVTSLDVAVAEKGEKV